MRLKNTFLAATVSVLATASTLFAADGWHTSIPEAQKVSKETQKPLLIEFTGSDWCPPCIMMHKNVFSKDKFLSEAKDDFILVKIDIPKGDKELSAKNQKVLDAYNITGVPTILLLDADGKEFSRFTASRFNTVDKMLTELERQLRMKDMF